MPIRNPFARRPGPAVQDENQRPSSAAGGGGFDAAHPGFERVDTVGSKASSAFSIRSRKSQDTGEYKLSVVNDSGVYLPPSPVEKEPTWPRRYLSRTSSDKSSVGSGEIEHFPISRESFDSYRRSFDICAKSPVVITDSAPARQSLDSTMTGRRFPYMSSRFPRSSLSDHLQVHHHQQQQQQRQQRQRLWAWDREQPLTPEQSQEDAEGGQDGEETFEDVGLNDDAKATRQHPPQQQQAKKRGFFFSKFGSDSGTAPAGVSQGEESGTAVSRFLPLPGRRNAPRGGDGGQQDAELGVIQPVPVAAGLDRPEPVGVTKLATEVEV